ncbi:MAG: FkbM family methyltransferase [Thalassobaculaceae bacterium]|nr:FkbM family methyltransferase [Thalassobaculaceae bacterium]
MEKALAFESSRPFIRIGAKDWAFQMYTPNRVCVWRVLSYFSKEPETISWLNAMPQGAVLFDVGANIGLYSVWAAFVRGATVYAFEPEAGNFSVLNENLRANGLTERCIPFCVGISDKVGFGTIQIRDTVAGTSGHQVQVGNGAKFQLKKPAAHQGIATASLDHLVYECGFPCPSHIKVDVDGIEHAVIKGASRLLGDPRLKSIMIELMVKESFHQEVIEILVAAGFGKDDAMERAVHEKTDGVAHTGNILFTRP